MIKTGGRDAKRNRAYRGRALDDLGMQRRKLAVDLKTRTGFDYRITIQQIEEDIIVIEAGPAQLDGAAAT